jgi:hypothetical protein
MDSLFRVRTWCHQRLRSWSVPVPHLAQAVLFRNVFGFNMISFIILKWIINGEKRITSYNSQFVFILLVFLAFMIFSFFVLQRNIYLTFTFTLHFHFNFTSHHFNRIYKTHLKYTN